MTSTSGTKSGGSTSFQKRRSDVSCIPGTKVSFHNAQLLTSTGVPSLDSIVGGGLAVGTVLLVEEDHFRTYSNLLLKYFAAEGIINGHSLLLASGDRPPSKILKELPAVVIEKPLHSPISTGEQLKIAWRYQDQAAPVPTALSLGYCYDLSKKMDQEKLKNCHISTWNPTELTNTEAKNQFIAGEPYTDLLQQIKKEIENGHFSTSEGISCKRILRIAICSLGSPLWKIDSNNKEDNAILQFLYVLRALLRCAFSVALITIPTHLFSTAKQIIRLRQMADTVLCLESFVGSNKNTNPLYKDYNGLLHIIKLPLLNTFIYQLPTADLAFKLKKKNFLIERLHLPPDLNDPSSSSQRENVSISCGSGNPSSKALDF